MGHPYFVTKDSEAEYKFSSKSSRTELCTDEVLNAYY